MSKEVPNRNPDIVLPKSALECEADLYLKEKLIALNRGGKSGMAHAEISSPIADYDYVGVDEYMKATVKYYSESEPRRQAIENYVAEQILLGGEGE